jgi:hypothetical protein
MLYGTGGVDWQTLTLNGFGGASGVVFCGNPPYTVTDFASVYPKFLGPPTPFSGLSTVAGTPTISGFTSTSGLAPGQLLVDPNFAKDTLILTVSTGSITVTNNAIASSSSESIVVYQTPFVPILIILNYVYLALASVMFSRYQEFWFMCVSFFVAHYLTLFMRTESGPNSTASQVASSGLTKGVLISRHAGDVGASSQLIQGYEQWGAWMETQYGEQFITIARAVNAGPILVS